MQCSSASNELSCSMPVQADIPQPHEPLQTVTKFSPKDTLLASGDQALSKTAQHTKTAEGEEREHQDLEQDCGNELDSKVKQKEALRDNHLPKDTVKLHMQKESVREKGLRKAVREPESKQGLLKKQLGSMADELAHHKSLVEKHKQDNKNLKIDKQAVQLQLSKAQYLIKCQNEIITRQGREVCFHHELLEDLQERTTGMQRTIRDLQNQADQMRKEEILASFHDLEEDFIFLAKNIEPPHLTKEHSQDGPRMSAEKEGFLGCLASLPMDVVTGFCTVGVFATLFILKTKLNT